MPFSYSYFEVQQGLAGLATCAEAQAYLSISRSTLWRLERAGVLQAVRIGRTLRFRWADLQRLAAEGGAQ